MKTKTPIVVLQQPADYVYRRLFIDDRLVLAITRYGFFDGAERQVQNDALPSAVAGYYLFMYLNDGDPPRLISKVPHDEYLLTIIAAKEIVASWLFQRNTESGAPPLSREAIVTRHEQARALLNQELRLHLAANGGRPVLECKVGEACTTHGLGDYGIYAEARAFFGKKCHIVSQTKKTGMYWVSLDDDHTQTFPFPKRNLDHVSKAAR